MKGLPWRKLYHEFITSGDFIMLSRIVKSSISCSIITLSILFLAACTNPLAVTLTQVPNAPFNLRPVPVANLVELTEKPNPLYYAKVGKASIRLFNGQEDQAVAAVKKRLANAGCTHIYFGPNPVEALNGQDIFYLPLGGSTGTLSMNTNTMRRKLVGIGFVKKK